MYLKEFIKEISTEQEFENIIESDNKLTTLCINKLNELVYKKSGGKINLEMNEFLDAFYRQLFLYLNRDERVNGRNIVGSSGKYSWDLNKGLMLIGQYGSGKTLILDFLQEVKGMFKIPGRHTNAYEICKLYDLEQKQKGFEGYSQLLNSGCLYIDEVGDEPLVSKSFGNEENVIYRTLKIKLDQIENQKEKDKIFMTSNLSIKEIKERYGDRVWDRIKGAMNIVVLGVQEGDKSFRK